MRFLCLLYFDQAEMNALGAAELAEMDREAEAYDARLIASGHYVTALALAAPRNAVLVRSRNGVVSSTDGPFAETKEHVGGLMIIEAADMAEARALVEADPMTRYATIEIRPEMDVGWQKRQQGR
jgi:hypothetical protein